MKIGMLVGSLRRDSFNLKVAHALEKLAPKNLELKLIPIDRLPFFNQDLEAEPPQEWVDFRQKIAALDGFILVTPEYNRSVPAVLKNALDVGSRPYGKSVWNAKPCAVVSASVGATGGFGANHHLRQSLVFLNTPCLQQPEVYLSYVDKLFDEKGQINNEKTSAFLGQFLNTYADWVSTHMKKA
jgi:chromate reductase